MKKLISIIVGSPLSSYPTGQERINKFIDAIKWRLGSLPFLDASVDDGGRVRLFY